MIQTQMIKGFIEGFILKVLLNNTFSSIEIITYLRQKSNLEISEGTIYPLMLRLERDQYVTSEQFYNPNGPKIKKYSITKRGIIELNLIKEYWNEFKEIATTLLEDKE
ncbi:PadR family transcriptional regulator [Acholeplasma granularum]|uniref:PadR family transcriptional regulator n=1 Tax=Acholeplasma granularum TaxID=264635 RepID=UPI0004B711CC|nr:PadR family transcriptional regulator [Acholeplasma granularum]